MIDRVRRTVARCHMLQNGSHVIVALSGGADSVSLLHVLYSLKEDYQLTITAAHLNHGIRGAEAQRDEHFCKILCENYHIPIIIRRAAIPQLATERKISEELCGREERYRFFRELSEQNGAKIATAHTASDNAETLLFHLTRGTAITGAAGIPPVRGNIIRPLIDCTRAEVEAYCAANGLRYVTDSTNLTDAYTRNKLRRSVIPVLKELNPNLEMTFARFCESAALAGEYLRTEAEKLLRSAAVDFGCSAEILLGAHPAVRNEALAQLCRREADFSPENRHIELLTGILGGGAVDLGEHTAVCKQGVLRFAPKSPSVETEETPFAGEITFLHGGKTIHATIQNLHSESNHLVFRQRRAGDHFTFPQRRVTKPLRKALNEQKIPSELRDRLLLLCRDSTVLWCEGLGYSEQGMILTKTNGLSITTQSSI